MPGRGEECPAHRGDTAPSHQGDPLSVTSTRQRIGLVLSGLINLSNIPSAFSPTPYGETGPPYAILVLGSVLGVIGLVATVMAWRAGNRAASGVAAGALVINVITALPPSSSTCRPSLRPWSSFSVVLTSPALVLMFSQAVSPAPSPVTEPRPRR